MKITIKKDENEYILSAVDNFNSFGADSAQAYLGALTGNFTSLLTNFVNAFMLVTNLEQASELGLNESEYEFYTSNLICFENAEARAERLAHERAEAAGQLTYTLSINAVGNPMLAMMVVRGTLGWDTVQARYNFDHVPCVAISTPDKEKVKDLMDKLIKGQMSVSLTAINGLGETVNVVF